MSFAELRFTFNYDGSLLAPPEQEKAPLLAVWTSQSEPNGDTRPMSFFPIEWADSARCEAKPIAASIRLPMQDGRVVIDRDLTLGLQIKAHSPTHHGDSGLRNCGVALVPLGHMLFADLAALNDNLDVEAANRDDFEAASRILSSRSTPLLLRFATLVDERHQHVIKGGAVIEDIHVVALDAEDDDAPKDPLPLEFRTGADGTIEPLTEFSYVPSNEALSASISQLPVVRSIMMFTEDALANNHQEPNWQPYGVHPTTKESMRIHAPYFNSEAGLLHGSAFATQPGDSTPPPGPLLNAAEDWMLGRARDALWLHNRSDKWFIETVNGQVVRTDNTYDDVGIPLACEIMVRALTSAPTAMPYMSDEKSSSARSKLLRVRSKHGFVQFNISADGSGLHSVEEFRREEDDDCGDCEDSANLAYRTALALADGDWSHPLMLAFQSLARQFVASINLTSVRDASIDNDITKSHQMRGTDEIDSEADRSQAYGAHMVGMLMPAMKFAALMRRSMPTLNKEMVISPLASRAPWTVGLPTLLLEGTGRVVGDQRVAVSAVLFDDADDSRRKATVKRHLRRQKLLAAILGSTRTFKRMGMVREQPRVVEAPNVRLTNFYRNLTHMLTAHLVRLGHSNTDILYSQCGPRKPIAAADATFQPNPLSVALRAPASSTSTALTVAGNEASAVDSRDGELAMELLGSPMRTKPPGAASLIGNSSDAKPPHVGRIVYGVPLYDVLQSPLNDSVALTPSTPMTGREVRVQAELMRHNQPISQVGDMRNVRRMHAAAKESLRVNCDIDVAENERAEDERFERLRTGIRRTMGTLAEDGSAPQEWPARDSNTSGELVSFSFAMPLLASDEVVDALVADIRDLNEAGTARYARVAIEQPMPHRRSVALQLFCKLPKLK